MGSVAATAAIDASFLIGDCPFLGCSCLSGLVALHPRIKIFHGGWPRFPENFPKKVRFEHKKSPRLALKRGEQAGGAGGLAVVGTGGLGGGRRGNAEVPFCARIGVWNQFFQFRRE